MKGLQVIGLDIAKHVFQIVPGYHKGQWWCAPLGTELKQTRAHSATVARKGRAPFCQWQQNRCHRCACDLAGGAAAWGEVCGHQDDRAASNAYLAPPTRVAHENAHHADQRLAQIPGVGLLTATAAIATMGEASAFKSGGEFCAWLGWVPKQTGICSAGG
jgi:hypothetical protein